MAAESEQPTAGEGSGAASEGGAERSLSDERERVGPLELLRTQKADGRALLLFSRARERP
ncbi:MAG TPA: hypothetical protein VL988_14745 [Solirubrobacteraceae bacterium]|nr:hypothetical protein [Solirubrobacteraceae bacterium]